ncbi:MAG: hypothetical protein WA060_02410 [Minisyncoccia bacterium]
MEVIWAQTFGNGCEVISFVGERPSEEDINLFWNDLDQTKKFIRAEINGNKHIEKILDVESGRDITSTPWARKLVTNIISDHHG